MSSVHSATNNGFCSAKSVEVFYKIDEVTSCSIGWAVSMPIFENIDLAVLSTIRADISDAVWKIESERYKLLQGLARQNSAKAIMGAASLENRAMHAVPSECQVRLSIINSKHDALLYAMCAVDEEIGKRDCIAGGPMWEGSEHESHVSEYSLPALSPSLMCVGSSAAHIETSVALKNSSGLALSDQGSPRMSRAESDLPALSQLRLRIPN